MTLQDRFTRALLDPAAVPPAGVVNPDGAPAQKRFDVYRNNVAVGLTEALTEAFPVVRKIVGEKFFQAMAGVYLRNHPPSSPLMMFYGDQMPGFLKGFEPVRGLPYLPDVARLELALRQAYHAKDAPPIGGEVLQMIAPDLLMRSRLTFAPAVQLLGSRFPFHAIWSANAEGTQGKIAMEPQSVLITRAVFDPKATRLDPPAARFVEKLLAGGSLAAAMASGGAGCDMAAILALLLTENAIVGVY